MALTLRNVKGSPLTYSEMDDNLIYLETLGGTASALDAVLAVGNATVGNNIVMTSGDKIISSNVEEQSILFDKYYGLNRFTLINSDSTLGDVIIDAIGGKLNIDTPQGSVTINNLVMVDAGSRTFQIGDMKIVLTDLPTYADNVAATAGGLNINTVYKTATGELRIVVL